MPDKNQIKSEIAKEKPRDSEEHFVHTEESKIPKTPQNPLSKFFHKTTDDSTLLDIHVGNPLRRIALLLEDIKRQKAFSFTLKGSLGIVGIALALSLFGIFGGGKLFCDKGVQSHLGVIKILSIKEQSFSTVPLLSSLIDLFNAYSSQTRVYPRTILLKTDNSTIHLPYLQGIDFTKYSNYPVIVTGSYDSRSQTLKLKDPQSIQYYR